MTAPTAPANGIGTYNVLLIEDDPNIARLVGANLQKVKMDCHHAKDGKAGLFAFEQKTPHLVLLDLMLPDMTGYEICTKIRQTSNVPIIMITARNEVEDQLQGLKCGADDYITKPFDPKLLVARVVAQLRRVHRYDAPPAGGSAGAAATASSASPMAGWTKCVSCSYLGPNEKFEEMDSQFRLSMVCPNCGTRVKENALN